MHALTCVLRPRQPKFVVLAQQLHRLTPQARSYRPFLSHSKYIFKVKLCASSTGTMTGRRDSKESKAARKEAKKVPATPYKLPLFGILRSVKFLDHSSNDLFKSIPTIQAVKAARRAQRQGLAASGSSEYGKKACDVCGDKKDLLIRCQTDERRTWRMVCGKCWVSVSGGVVDGDEEHPHYRYGGLWKNLKASK